MAEQDNTNGGQPTEQDFKNAATNEVVQSGQPETTMVPGEGDEGETEQFVLGDRTFKTQEEMTEWWDNYGSKGLDGPEEEAAEADGAEGEPNDDGDGGGSDPETSDTAEAQPEDPDRPWFAKDTRTDDEIRASLKESGGIYADPAYEAAALEFARTGDVTEETLATTAEGLGVTVEQARSWVDAQIAIRKTAHEAYQKGLEAGKGEAPKPISKEEQAQATAIENLFGGREGFDKFNQWSAKGGLTEGQRNRVNGLLQAGDGEGALELLTIYKGKYDESGEGGSPRNVTKGAATGDAPGTKPKGAQPFASQREQDDAYGDPRYGEDKAFTAEVQARALASNFS